MPLDKPSPFSDLSPEACRLIYPAMVQNAYRHLDVAQEIAGKGEYGIANSHLVMSAEEYIRGLSVYLKGFGLPVEEIRRLANFYKEQESGFLISPAVILMGNFARALYGVFDGLKQSVLNLNFGEFRNAIDEYLRPVELYSRSTRYADWWSKAKVLQSRGLYVEYDHEISTPSGVTEADYHLSLEIVLELRESCLATIDVIQAIPEERRKEFLTWIKNYYEPFLTRLNQWPFSLFSGK